MRNLNEARTVTLSRLRAWWPELLAVALIGTVSFPARGRSALDDVLVAVFAAIFWAMGFRHRHLPLHAKLDKVGQDVTEVKDILLAGDNEAGDEQADGLHLVR